MFRRTPMLSYEGALRVLSKYDHPWLDKADVFFGVSILVGGAVEPSLLGLVDPKNEATASLRKLLDEIGPNFDALEITDREKFRILGTEPGGKKEVTALPDLTRMDVPAPNAVRGFHENLHDAMWEFFHSATGEVIVFISGLAARPSRP